MSMRTISSEEIKALCQKANQLRCDILEMITEAGSGHPGGSLSIADIMVTLYFKILHIDPRNPDWPERDRLVLSKGHAAPALYAVLAARGFFDRKILRSLRKLGSPLQGHPDMTKLPGVEISTGSLGQGLSVANGMALAARIDKLNYRVYVIIGDGEVQEGQIWEAAMTAAHYRLDNLIAFLDFNGLQIDGPVAEVMSLEPLTEKWRAFGWYVIEVDGHDIEAILQAVAEAQQVKGQPAIIIARTVKGKGVSFMENQVDWHGKAPKKEELEQALKELKGGGMNA